MLGVSVERELEDGICSSDGVDEPIAFALLRALRINIHGTEEELIARRRKK